MKETEAATLLTWVDNARGRTRAARQGFWFPLLLFGLVILGAVPLYAVLSFDELVASGRLVPTGDGVTYNVGQDMPASLDLFGGFTGDLRHSPLWPSVYWLVAIPLGYAATVWYYRRRARRTGAAGPILPYVFAGLGLLALLIVRGGPLWSVFPGLPAAWNPLLWLDWAFALVFPHGLTPLLTIALALFVLARLERSRALALIAAGFLAVALTANLYNVENLVYRIAKVDTYPTLSGEQVNLLLAAAALLVMGLGAWLASMRRVR